MRWLVLAGLSLSTSIVGADVADIPQLRVYTDEPFASAGQPEPRHYIAIAAAGYERVVYLAYSDHPPHGEANDRLAHAAGLDYVHIPVRFDEPRYDDFAVFAAVLNAKAKPTFVHCQVNYRASAFSFLYRVIFQDVTVAEAKRDLDAIWRPNPTWQAFMRETLDQHGVSMDCAGCDWQVGAEH